MSQPERSSCNTASSVGSLTRSPPPIRRRTECFPAPTTRDYSQVYRPLHSRLHCEARPIDGREFSHGKFPSLSLHGVTLLVRARSTPSADGQALQTVHPMILLFSGIQLELNIAPNLGHPPCWTAVLPCSIADDLSSLALILREVLRSPTIRSFNQVGLVVPTDDAWDLRAGILRQCRNRDSRGEKPLGRLRSASQTSSLPPVGDGEQDLGRC